MNPKNKKEPINSSLKKFLKNNLPHRKDQVYNLEEISESEMHKNPLWVIFNKYFKMKTGNAFFKGFVKPFVLGKRVCNKFYKGSRKNDD